MLSDLLLSLIGFVLRNFFLIVILGASISTIHHLLTQSKKDAILHKGPMILYLIVVIGHMFLYWNLAEDRDLLVLAAQCILPAFVTLMAGGGVHEMNCGPRKELLVMGITYAVSYLLAVLFTGWLVSLITLVLGLVLAGVVFSEAGKQSLMDMHSRDQFGDSETVQQLYQEGYRPTDFYRTDEKGQQARDDLLHHGVNPYE